jgi:hypothetical protein
MAESPPTLKVTTATATPQARAYPCDGPGRLDSFRGE